MENIFGYGNFDVITRQGSVTEDDVKDIIREQIADGSIHDALVTKVDKVTGKGLSTNDLTNELKGKYDGYESQISSISSSVSGKADKTYVDTELGKKASATDVSALSGRTTELETFKTTASSDIANLQEYKADKTALDNKVDKVAGSRLMSETEGTKLAGIEAGANVNKIEIVKQNGTALVIDPTDKSVNVTGSGPTPIVNPTATIVSCPDALSSGDTLTVKAKGIKGTYDLLDLSLYFNGTKVNHKENPVSGTEYDLTYDIPTTLESGTYEVKVVVEADGNTSGEAKKNIVIGIDVKVTSCPETGTIGQEITIKAIPYKGTEPIGRLTLKVNGSAFDSVEDPESGKEYSLKYTPIETGTNTIKVIVNDFFMHEKVVTKEIAVSAASADKCYFGVWNCESEVPEEQFYVALDPVAGMPTESKSATYTYNYTLTEYQKPVYKYPKKFGDLISITDGATQYINSFVKTEETISGQVHNVYTAESETDYRNTTLYFS